MERFYTRHSASPPILGAAPPPSQRDDMMRDLLSSAHAWCVSTFREREEVPVMAIVGGVDIHRRQVTFDYLDTVTGQVCRGRIDPACLSRCGRGWGGALAAIMWTA